ncbi:copper oxidase, partial [Mesorhizobium sp. M4A.F.Ca.ET.050.02.1.1]
MIETKSLLGRKLDRRLLLAGGLAAAGGTAVVASAARGQTSHAGHEMPAVAAAENQPAHLSAHGAMMTVGEVDDTRNGFDPVKLVNEWETGTVST